MESETERTTRQFVEHFDEIKQPIGTRSPLLMEMAWKAKAREAVAQLRKMADEIEAVLNGPEDAFCGDRREDSRP